jgi:beta-phosphoglucomutase-like phosphatase (HAD superfamily)
MTHTAVLFDMDGVLVDSEPVINAAAIRALAEFGIRARPEDFLLFGYNLLQRHA